MTRTVAVVGSLNLDLTVDVDHLPSPGETVLGSGSRSGYGGKGANQAAAAAALGSQVAMVGRVGDDAVGEELVADLRHRGIDVAHLLRTPGVRSGSATIAVDATRGENLILVDPGANGAVTAADVRVQPVREAAVVVAQLEIPLPAVTAAAAHARGLVLLNPAPARELPRDLVARVDVLVPNQSELALLTAAPTPATVEETATLVRGLGFRGAIVVTLGAAGALVYEPAGDAVLHVPAPTVRVVDTTGAGDCFCGALAVALAAGERLSDAARTAVIAASLSTRAHGARDRLPSAAEVQQLATA
jgi:ribokinase